MSKYKVTGIIYMRIETRVSERNAIRENFHAKHSVFTAPDARMPYITQLCIVSMQPATKAVERLISS